MKGVIIDQLKSGATGFDVATADYLTLSNAQKEALAYWAKQYRYRKPRNANGSTGRYFFEMLARHANRKKD